MVVGCEKCIVKFCVLVVLWCGGCDTRVVRTPRVSNFRFSTSFPKKKMLPRSLFLLTQDLISNLVHYCGNVNAFTAIVL